MRENWKRILLGLLAVLLIGRVFNYFLPVYEPNASDSVEDIQSYIFRFVAIAYFWSCIAFAVGGFVARKKFLLPAMALATAEWIHGAVSGYMGAYNFAQEYDQIEVSFEHGDMLSSFVWSAGPHLFIFVALAAVAAVAGMRIFQAMKSRRITA